VIEEFMKRIVTIISLLFCTSLLHLVGCGGGSGDSGTIIEGTLTQKGSVVHSAGGVNVKHSDGERIEEVKICVATECSITDGNGQWGVNIPNFQGGEMPITVDGHGILGSTMISLPATAKDVQVDLGRNKNIITVEKLTIDGEDHTGHDHSH
jgi:hypothetical protein